MRLVELSSDSLDEWGRAYPRPQLRRNTWYSLNGRWDFAIDVKGEAVGGIGLVLRTDVERVDAELGYWLGESHWGRGVMSGAVDAFVPWALDRFNLARVHAQVFAFNGASARVLAKAGFVLEGRMRQSAVKDGKLIDQLLYARVREGWRPT